MKDRITTARALGATALVLALAACTGKGANDTLADGAVDRASANNGSTGVGPGAPPVDSAGPGEGNSAAQPAATAQGAASGGTMLTLVAQGPHGPYIADSSGTALYYANGDRDGSLCTGPCLQAWPPVTAADQQPMGAAGLEGAKIATITRAEGTRQVTFDGHPLYRYAADGGMGHTNGDGVKDKFATWHLASPGAPAAGNGAMPTAGGAKGATPPAAAASPTSG